MGATTRGSLVMVVNPQATPPYGTMAPIHGTVPLHPDGAIFPGTGNLRAADIHGRPVAYHLHDGNNRRGCQPLDRWQRGHAGRPAAEEFAHGRDAASALQLLCSARL